MAVRGKPPFRADHVGSLLRPPALLAARQAYAEGQLAADELGAAEDAAIKTAVRMQEDVGLRGVTDGEYRRASWHMDFLYQLGGVAKTKDNLEVAFHSDHGDIKFTPSGVRVVGKLKLDAPIFAQAFGFLKSQVTAGVAKLTIPSPSMLHYRGGAASIDPQVYPTMDGFWSDLSHAYADEIEALGKIGCAYLQLDDTSLAYLNDPEQRRHVTAIGGREDQHLTYIGVINAALAKRPADMTIATHMCRGNYRSSWVASGGYDYVADAIFNQLQVDAYFLEYDDDRSGGFEPLRLVPKDKVVVLGLITTKRPQLEDKTLLKRRLDEASKFIDLDQVCLSPQCGFSSTVEGNDLTWDEQRRKLELVVETAREVWGAT
ncbi:MAG: 5-methyltetrahydropteroyltriglutamate--homocysteine S-methyltransferase [Caulobacterales bacterium]